MDFNLIQLEAPLALQREVDAVIREKSVQVSHQEVVLAFNVEFFEFLNEVGVWKWWKHSHQPKRDRVLDELADCFAFFFKLVNLGVGEEYDGARLSDGVIKVINSYESYFAEQGITDNYEKIKLFSVVLGSDNEAQFSEAPFSTVERFAAAIYIASLVFPDTSWDEMYAAYQQKSKVNIERQKNNY